jgi:nucleoside-diphosphate-sugar epimerase
MANPVAPLKVLITGAAGRVGSLATELFHRAGDQVRAVDRRGLDSLPTPVHVVDLQNYDAVCEAVRGMDLVIHLANRGSYNDPAAHLHHQTNVAMNFNVFQAAVVCGVPRVIWASSIQAIDGCRRRDAAGQTPPSRLPYLPLDGETPANPGNPYALAKAIGEMQLQFFVRQHGLSAVALRFPMLVSPESVARFRANPSQQHGGPFLDEAFSYLKITEAATLLRAIALSEWSGYRCYLPAAPDPLPTAAPADLVRRYFAGVPLKKPIEQLTRLVDISRITAETGWRSTPLSDPTD